MSSFPCPSPWDCFDWEPSTPTPCCMKCRSYALNLSPTRLLSPSKSQDARSVNQGGYNWTRHQCQVGARPRSCPRGNVPCCLAPRAVHVSWQELRSLEGRGFGHITLLSPPGFATRKLTCSFLPLISVFVIAIRSLSASPFSPGFRCAGRRTWMPNSITFEASLEGSVDV